MKRVISCLLAVVLVFSLCIDGRAVEGDSTGAGEPSAAVEDSASDSETPEPGGSLQETIAANGEDNAGTTDGTGGDSDSQATSQGTGETAGSPAAGETDADVSVNDVRNLFSAAGQDPDPKSDTAETEDPEKKNKKKVVEERRMGKPGQVDVSILSGQILQGPVEFMVTLMRSDNFEFGPKRITLDPPGVDAAQGMPARGDATFEGLEPGTYDLKVKADGFADFSQTIEVDGWAYAVTLMTEKPKMELEGAHPGFLLIGDVDRNGVIDDADRDMLVDAVDAAERDPEKKVSGGANSASGTVLDLNRSGEIDLADLECLAKGYQVTGDNSSTVTSKVPADAVKANAVSGTEVVQGDVHALLKNEGSVQLQPANGGNIGTENPVSVEFVFSGSEYSEEGKDSGIMMAGMEITAGKGDTVEYGEIKVTYTDEDGTEHADECIPIVPEGVHTLLLTDTVHVTRDLQSGAVCIDFGRQIAVKKVTLTIKAMQKDNTLAEISQVEFLNNMENRIPEPELNIPGGLKVEPESEAFTLSWIPETNVTGYEVKISSEKEEEPEETILTKGTTLRISSFGKKSLVNNTTYTAAVRSVNGAWCSPYSEAVSATPKANKKPDPPDGLKLAGAYRSIRASWKNMKDTDSYNLYYREKGESTYQKIENIGINSHTIPDLKDQTGYEVYVTGVNELGESKPSLTGTAETISIEPAQMPKYKMINPASDGKVSEHIAKAYFVSGSMKDSPLDQDGSKTAWGTVDNDPLSHFYLGIWDSGGYNNLGNNGLFYEFDQAYKLQSFALQEVSVQSPNYYYVKVKYWDESGKAVEKQCSMTRKLDSDKRVYYLVRLPEAVTTNKIQFGLARYQASGTITCSEVYFYHYDSLEDDIMALYTDDLHTELREDVTQATIDELRKRINTPDEVSGEYHPDQEKLERELKTAEDILKAADLLSKTLKVHNTITTSDINRGFGGLNAWQPLGVTAAAGEEITVYVGHNTKKTGDSADLQLVATQYHSESGAVSGGGISLKVGRNDITVPQLATVNAEAGGALYVQYTGKSTSDQYAVRVSGGVQVPCLDLYQVSDAAERQRRAEQYVKELAEYVGKMEAQHEEKHAGSKLGTVKYDYNAQNCILGASDILSDTMLLSLPAAQIQAASNGNAQTILTSIDAMEKMMHLFYQHKGLSAQAPAAADQYPSRHLNIRYQRMFAGAFMYASGNHIGIEWPQTGGMVSGAPVVADGEGKYVSGNYFGWGIAHEIGHCINQGAYAVAEITNNYYSVLAQAQDTNSSVRFQYGNVYKKVTSGTKGPASNVFTQLGMYWQLHLAYDNGYNFKTYDNYDQQIQNLFFARVDTYARTPSKAKAPGGVALALTGDKDQNLMRLSCAAAEKNLLEFFRRWGMTPDQGTIAYASQFEEETRAIFYVNDESRVYRLTHGGSLLDAAGTVPAVGDVTAQIRADSPNQVDFQLSATIPADDVLGYEIVRCTRSGGKLEEEVAGFTTGDTFNDSLMSLNNRVVTYKVTVIDQYLNRSAPKTLGEIKIQDNGSIDKSNWTVSAAGLESTVDTEGSGAGASEDKPCAPVAEDPILRVVDGKTETAYTGRAGDNAEVIMQFNRSHVITGFEYRPAQGVEPVKDYTISVCDESGQWIEAASGTFGSDAVQTVIFANKDGKNLAGYQATAVKLSIRNQKGKEIGISELDVLGVTGDDVDFRYTEGQAAAGRLENAFTYGDRPEDVIPAGSLVFTGAYKGNPAYNVVVLYDQDGNIVSGAGTDGSSHSDQIIIADVPKEGNIQNVSDGSWVYWIEPQYQVDLEKLKSIRVELYRVDDAFNNTGQRLVSDSLSVEVNPQMLQQPINLTSSRQRQ